MLSTKSITIATITCTLLVLTIFSCNTGSKPVEETTYQDYLNFPEKLTPITPYDVDTALEHKLQSEQKFAETQRLFEILSWQMFVSINWPVDEKGKPKPEITDDGKRIWESWKESFDIFKPDGSKPLVWGSETEVPKKLKKKFTKNEDTTLVLFRTSALSSLIAKKKNKNKTGRFAVVKDTADEVDQAFTSPIWDQNGNIVRYEIRMNKPTVDYIVTNDLYNIQGQVAFSQSNKTVNFPSSTVSTAGSIELKFAWKIMVPGVDAEERYFTKTAYVYETDSTVVKRKVGLIGMHIGTKTVSSPQWIWATFEHVDNLETNPLEKVNGKPLKPSFNDPDNSICPINLIPDTSKKPVKNQIQRVIPIPKATQQLNKQVQALLKAKKSYWQYYELIGTQWPTQPLAAPYNPTKDSIYKLPDAVTNKSGGYPTPTYLTNMIMETYFQGATTVNGNPLPGTNYNFLIANEPAYFQIQGFPLKKDTANTHKIIFGTEGCVGCHSSASVATSINADGSVSYGKSGDFEWLLQLKAQMKK